MCKFIRLIERRKIMKFHFKKEREIYVPQTVDEKLIIEKYMQSFLCWIYKQNEDFSLYLTREEISNYFFNHLIHPIWFEIYMKQGTFQKATTIDTYIHNYKSKPADKIFAYHYLILPKDEGEYSYITTTEEPILKEQVEILLKGGYGKTDIRRLSKEEADYVISKIKL